MNAFKTYAEVDEQGRLVVEGVPFRAGSLVEVLLVDSQADAYDPNTWRALFEHIRSLPQSRGITEADIAEEIDAYRSGR
ncbi:hypothetical protein [Thiohalocapsa sp. ML1]|jgi:hypothetical protein|uniref:hypothetical protein n=1 Tax=Thiohalocapsa sp. ML1 TaxID=1431688 RepID=UPI0007323663|nr:hypothetical protein [Thiohalocapsa sp. ML1]